MRKPVDSSGRRRSGPARYGAWVLADALYGSDTPFRRMLERRGQPYVVAVRSNNTLRFLQGWPLVQTDPATLAATLEDDDWSSLAAAANPIDSFV